MASLIQLWSVTLVLILGSGPASAEAELTLQTLLHSLSQPTPAETPFLELRTSPLLAEPLVVFGRLQHPDPETLVREVQQPFSERTEVRAGRVVMQREGERVRRFSLRNAPELAAILDSFRALLGGDVALLERSFSVRLTGDETAWSLDLEPLDPRVRRRIQALRLYGAGDRLQCLELTEAEGGFSQMLLGSSLPDPNDAQALAARCAAVEG